MLCVRKRRIIARSLGSFPGPSTGNCARVEAHARASLSHFRTDRLRVASPNGGLVRGGTLVLRTARDREGPSDRGSRSSHTHRDEPERRVSSPSKQWRSDELRCHTARYERYSVGWSASFIRTGTERRNHRAGTSRRYCGTRNRRSDRSRTRRSLHGRT